MHHHILLTLACNPGQRHVLCRGGSLSAQTMCGHLAGSTCHGPAQPLTPAGCPVAPARGTANWASSTLPTLASARRYIHWPLCITAEVGAQLWLSTVLQPAADMTQSGGKTWIDQCTQRHLPTGGLTFSSCALLSECAATET